MVTAEAELPESQEIEEADIYDDPDDPDDPYNRMINFKSIRTSDGLETAVEVQWKEDSSTRLHLSTILPEDELAPLFAGAQWAGTRIWQAAVAMVEFLVQNYAAELQDPEIKLLELGCGLGVPGMLCHKLYGTETFLTDQESIMSQLEINVEENFPEEPRRIQARTLTWSMEALRSFPLDFGIVMSCDCIYEPLYGESWKLLVQVLEHFLRQNPDTVVLTSCERRASDGIDKFLTALRASSHVDRVDKVWSDDGYELEIYQAYGVGSEKS